jgi:hypothetical protein
MEVLLDRCDEEHEPLSCFLRTSTWPEAGIGWGSVLPERGSVDNARATPLSPAHLPRHIRRVSPAHLHR